MDQNFKQTANAKCSETMETGDHFKNGAILKSHTSRIIFNRVAMTVIALCVSFSVSAQWREMIATEVSPDTELTLPKNIEMPNGKLVPLQRNTVVQNGKILKLHQVKEALAGNSVALQQYNSGVVLNIVGRCVSVPCACAVGYGLGVLIAYYVTGADKEIRAGTLTGSGILIGIGAADMATGFLIAHLGMKKIENAVNLHNSGLKRDVSYQMDFGITPTGGVGLTLRF